MRAGKLLFVTVVAALAGMTVALAGSGLAYADDRHPDVGPSDDADACQTCHAHATPEIVQRWEGGAHGLVLVKCFACHGSTGKDFAAHPATARCAGCHAAEVASVAPAPGKKAKRDACSSCHVPHTLAVRDGAASPHDAR